MGITSQPAYDILVSMSDQNPSGLGRIERHRQACVFAGGREAAALRKGGVVGWDAEGGKWRWSVDWQMIIFYMSSSIRVH